jgi:N-acetylmuramoyl-L-alanine amidase
MMLAGVRIALLARCGLLAACGFLLPADGPARAASRPAGAAVSSLTLGGVEYTDLSAFCARFGFSAPAINNRQVVFKSAWTTLALEINSREQRINGVRVFFGEPLRTSRGRVMISRIDADLLLAPILRPGFEQARVPALRTIILDPGHGGRDSGMVNQRLRLMEKTLTLDTARRTARLLEAQGFRVILTRKGDSYVDLEQRAALIEKHRADLFISLHFNAVESGADRVTGIETFTLTPRRQFSTGDSARTGTAAAARANPGNLHDHWNTVLGYTLHRQLRDDLQASDRGLKRARFKVLTLARCPAVLVEAGYLSHEGEARKIATPAHRQKIAAAVADGVKAYAGLLAAARKQ